ncbi:hypothetical protein OAH12_01750 [Cyclobacteriaceae bacterium]|nr:hypothetical protein [Cyclobacteriaceae bacterium]
MKTPHLTPFELDVFEHCQQLFNTIDIINDVPFPVIGLKEGLYIQVISLSKLSPSPDLTYFQNIADDFATKNQQIIFLWEDLWVTKRAIVLSRLQSYAQASTKIHGRETICSRIDKKTFFDFLTENHLQLPANGKFKFGLFLKDQLVAVAGFSSPKKYYRDDQVSKSSELVRFCNIQGHTVIGGFDKILKHYTSNHEVDDIMSYADRDWSTGKSYEKIGFNKIENTPAISFWIHQKEMKRIFQHQAFSQLGTDDEKTLINKGYQKITNSGNIKYIKFLSKN